MNIIMDGERKVNLCEGVPLNTPGAANIFLNTGKKPKLNSQDGTIIHLNTEKPADVGVHINTTFSIASSKKIKLLFILNFLLSVVCMIISCSVAFYYWNEIIAMRRQLDTLKDQLLLQSLRPDAALSQDRPEHSALVNTRFKVEARVPRMETVAKDDVYQNARRYYVEDLGEDMLLVDSSKKSPNMDKVPVSGLPLPQKDLLVAHFNGGIRETNIGTKSFIGPWVRDKEVSSPDSERRIELKSDFFTVNEGGLYLVYAQIVYLTRAPTCFFVWARSPGGEPRLVATCASADVASERPLDRSQISCHVQTVARLSKGDTVNLAQREQNRTLWLRQGYSYIGFIKLSS